MSKPLYVIFDGPPGPQSGRFVELEAADGQSVVSGARWEQHGDSGAYWRLGPFFEAAEIALLREALEAGRERIIWRSRDGSVDGSVERVTILHGGEEHGEGFEGCVQCAALAPARDER